MLRQVNRIERLHNLIKLKSTGTLKECANRLDISERQLYNVIETMKEMGAPIYYDNHRKSYCYRYSVYWNFGFTSEVSDEWSNNSDVVEILVDKNDLLKFHFSE